MDIITIGQILSAIAVIGLVLMQDKSSGVGGLFGGGSGGDLIASKRRGMEKTIFNATIGVVVTFVILSILNLIL